MEMMRPSEMVTMRSQYSARLRSCVTSMIVVPFFSLVPAVIIAHTIVGPIGWAIGDAIASVVYAGLTSDVKWLFAAVFVLALTWGTNYFFLNTASPNSPLALLLEVTGPAWYLPAYALLAVAVMVVLLLPWHWRRE